MYEICNSKINIIGLIYTGLIFSSLIIMWTNREITGILFLRRGEI